MASFTECMNIYFSNSDDRSKHYFFVDMTSSFHLSKCLNCTFLSNNYFPLTELLTENE